MHPGCAADGVYGEHCFLRGDPARERVWCADHVPDHFWNNKRKAEAEARRVANPEAFDPASSVARVRKGQGVLL